MVDPFLEAHTEWVETSEGKWLIWTCPDCEIDMGYERRFATIRCPVCERIMQAANYSVDPHKPDHENPEWVLRGIARRRGIRFDTFMDKITPDLETQSSLDW